MFGADAVASSDDDSDKGPSPRNSPVAPPKGRRRAAEEFDDAPPPSPPPPKMGPNTVSFESRYGDLDEQSPPRSKAAGRRAADPFGETAPPRPRAAKLASKPASRVPKGAAMPKSDGKPSDSFDMSFDDGMFVSPEIARPVRGKNSTGESLETDIAYVLAPG
jgi:hypothetical protein